MFPLICFSSQCQRTVILLQSGGQSSNLSPKKQSKTLLSTLSSICVSVLPLSCLLSQDILHFLASSLLLLIGYVPNFITVAGSTVTWVGSQHVSAIIMHELYECIFFSYPSIHSSVQPFIHLSSHSSHRKSVPAAPPNGSSMICGQTFQTHPFRHMHGRPKWCQEMGRVLHGAAYAQCSFLWMTFPPALMNQNLRMWRERQKGAGAI